MKKEIQSVEISCFIHATEDLERVSRTLEERFGLSAPPQLEDLEGHFGNRIISVRYHLTGEEATTAFRGIASFMGSERIRELLAGIELALDEHKALFIRLSKQDLLRGSAVLSQVDPIRIKVKPRGYMLMDDAGRFYTRLLGDARRDD